MAELPYSQTKDTGRA